MPMNFSKLQSVKAMLLLLHGITVLLNTHTIDKWQTYNVMGYEPFPKQTSSTTCDGLLPVSCSDGTNAPDLASYRPSYTQVC